MTKYCKKKTRRDKKSKMFSNIRGKYAKSRSAQKLVKL